jgi:hypothetical protein
MIRKSMQRLSGKIMPVQRAKKRDDDSNKSHRTLAAAIRAVCADERRPGGQVLA